MSSGLKKLVGQVVCSIYHDEDRIVFRYGLHDYLEMKAYGDCCSKSWIESVEMIPGAVGARVTAILHDNTQEATDLDGDCLQFYKTIIRTTHGDITIDYRNSSNGYYGGYLEETPFDSTNLPRLFASIDPERTLKELI